MTTMQATEIAKLPGDAYGHVLVHMDLDLLTEAMTAPHTRQPPSRKPQLNRLINSFLALRAANAPEDAANTSCKMVRGDVFLFRDGGKRAVADYVSKLLVNGKGRWSTVARQENLFKLSTHVMISEDSLKERRSRVRGVGALKQLTGLHAFMYGETNIPEKSRIVFSGSNMGDVLGPVGFQKWSESWKVPIDVKKAMYGDNIRPVGGRNPGDDGGDGDDDDNANDAATAAAASAEDEDDDKNRPNFQVETSSGKKKAEPAFWWALPEKYYKEVKHSYYGRRIIDLSPGPGNFLIASWDETPPTPYIGVCFGSTHQSELMDHAVDEYLVRMATEGHPVYNKDYAKFKLEFSSATAGSGGGDGGAPPPPLPPKPKAKAAGKRLAAARIAASNLDDEAAGDPAAPGQEEPAAAGPAAAGPAASGPAAGGGSLEALLAGLA